MNTKLLVVCCVVTLCAAHHIPGDPNAGHHVHHSVNHPSDGDPAFSHVDYEHNPPNYKFSYSVYDPNTGDRKDQTEEKTCGRKPLVVGNYTQVQSDGNVRTITYTADKHKGFNADVNYNIIHEENKE